jgi:hypothetical protein
MNWTGKVTVAPRTQLAVWRRAMVKRTGIYVLTGDAENPSQEIVYIGESDNVWDRLANHNRDPKGFGGEL